MLVGALPDDIAFQQIFIPGEGGRVYTARRRSSSQFARQPAPGSPGDAAAAPKISATPPARGRDSTDAIDQVRTPVASAPSVRQ
jgi:hypothetical protein